MPTYVYLFRVDSGSREDYWPESAHATFQGAVKALKDYLKRENLTTSLPDDIKENEDSFIRFVVEARFHGELLITRMEVTN